MMLSKADKAKVKRAVRAHNVCLETECIAHVKRELAIYDPCIVAIVDGRIRRYNSWREAYLHCGSIDEADQSFVHYFDQGGSVVEPWEVRAFAYSEGRDARHGTCTHFDENLCQCRHTGKAESIIVHVSYFGDVTIEALRGK